jgi:hypothetical protein
MRSFEARLKDGRKVVVVATPAGLDYALTINGLRMRSLYTPEGLEDSARYLVKVRHGDVCSWRETTE